MSGQIKNIIDSIIAQKSKGDGALSQLVKTKLVLKGIDPAKFSVATPDDPAIIQKLKQIAMEFQVAV